MEKGFKNSLIVGAMFLAINASQIEANDNFNEWVGIYQTNDFDPDSSPDFWEVTPGSDHQTIFYPNLNSSLFTNSYEQMIGTEKYQTQYFRVQEQEIKRLFEARPILVNQAIVASVNNSSNLPNIQQHLARNAREIGNIFTSLFNPAIGKQIEALLDQAALINTDLGNAIRANNLVLANQLLQQADINGRRTAEFLGGLFFRISFPTWEQACENYARLTSQQTIAYFQHNNALGETLRNQCIIQFKEISILIAQALDFQINPAYTSY